MTMASCNTHWMKYNKQLELNIESAYIAAINLGIHGFLTNEAT